MRYDSELYGAGMADGSFLPVFPGGIFTSDKALAKIAAPALKLFFAGFLMMGFMFCGQATFVGLGFPKQAIFSVC